MRLISDVEFITVDKRAGLAGYRDVRAALRGRHFDVLVHLQSAFRASLIGSMVRADIKLGYDRERARELQWLFTNAAIDSGGREHVQDAMLRFADALGVHEKRVEWNVPLSREAIAYANEQIPPGTQALIINPCSSIPERNWAAERYAAVAGYAAERHGLRVILAGGPSELERTMGAAIERAARLPLVNQIGKDTLPLMLGLLARARALLSPDSGPVHMATMVGTPVIGLYAVSNVDRTGPYLSRQWYVDRHADALRQFLGKSVADVRWTRRIEVPGVMDLITVSDVCAKLDALLASDSNGTRA
jgi:heptosyltransferase I